MNITEALGNSGAFCVGKNNYINLELAFMEWNFKKNVDFARK
jgi:hypothetical protein